MLDDFVNSARDATREGWDDIREARVLQRVLDADTTVGVPSRSRWPVAATVAAVLVLGAWAWSMRTPAEPARVASTWMTEVPAPSPAPGTPAEPVPGTSILRFSDGSAATLREGAEVEVRRDTPTRVEVAQLDGAATYAAPAVAGREFRVASSRTSIRAEVAVFNVAVAGDAVMVDVEHGFVVVVEEARTVRLGAGESISIRAGVDAADLDPTSPRRARTEGPTAAALMARADAARRAGDLGEAADALHELLRRYPKDSRAPAASFTLGRVESNRGRHRAAARAYEATWRRDRRGSLAEDALGRAASAWALAHEDDQAARVARRYLQRYPTGVHSERMRALVF